MSGEGYDRLVVDEFEREDRFGVATGNFVMEPNFLSPRVVLHDFRVSILSARALYGKRSVREVYERAQTSSYWSQRLRRMRRKFTDAAVNEVLNPPIFRRYINAAPVPR